MALVFEELCDSPAQDFFETRALSMDTDFRMFSADYLGSLPGIDVAQVLDGAAYHSKHDTVARIRAGTIQARTPIARAPSMRAHRSCISRRDDLKMRYEQVMGGGMTPSIVCVRLPEANQAAAIALHLQANSCACMAERCEAMMMYIYSLWMCTVSLHSSAVAWARMC